MNEEGMEAKRYRERAEEIRTKAAMFTDEKTREMFVGIAADYDRMADTLDRIRQSKGLLSKAEKAYLPGDLLER